MSKFTITVNDAQIERFILNMLSLLKNNPGIEFKKKGNSITITTVHPGENMMLGGKPFTWEELTKEIAASEEEYSNGDYLSSDQLKKDVQNW